MAGGGGATIICFSTIFLARRWIHFSKKFPWQTKVLSMPVKRIDSILFHQISLLKKQKQDIKRCALEIRLGNQTLNFEDLFCKDKSTHKNLLIHNSYSIAPQKCLPPFVLYVYDFLKSKQVLKRIIGEYTLAWTSTWKYANRMSYNIWIQWFQRESKFFFIQKKSILAK